MQVSAWPAAGQGLAELCNVGVPGDLGGFNEQGGLSGHSHRRRGRGTVLPACQWTSFSLADDRGHEPLAQPPLGGGVLAGARLCRRSGDSTRRSDPRRAVSSSGASVSSQAARPPSPAWPSAPPRRTAVGHPPPTPSATGPVLLRRVNCYPRPALPPPGHGRGRTRGCLLAGGRSFGPRGAPSRWQNHGSGPRFPAWCSLCCSCVDLGPRGHFLRHGFLLFPRFAQVRGLTTSVPVAAPAIGLEPIGCSAS